MTEVVVSDGIAVLVNYARAKQQEISDASIVCLQCIARADKRYRTAIRALTHDKALDERIFPGELLMRLLLTPTACFSCILTTISTRLIMPDP